MRINKKIALVTGAGSGIGQETAVTLAREGATVIVTDINEEGINKTVQLIESKNGKALGLVLNVIDRKNWESVLKEVIDRYKTIDILVNDAGVSCETPYQDVTDDEWNRVMDINTRSVFISTQLVIPIMKKNGGGSIVNVASMAGIHGNCGAGPYTASKSALISYTKALAHDFGPDKIRFNNVCPGYIQTAMSRTQFEDPEYHQFFEAHTPLPYLGEPADIANAILFLASDESKYITGISLVVDGGTTLA